MPTELQISEQPRAVSPTGAVNPASAQQIRVQLNQPPDSFFRQTPTTNQNTTPSQNTSPTLAQPQAAITQAVVLDLNQRLNNANSQVRAVAALDFYKILEQNPAIALPNSMYRPLIDAFMVKILKDPDALVRQPAELAMETKLYEHLPKKVTALLQGLKDGAGLENLEPDIISAILAKDAYNTAPHHTSSSEADSHGLTLPHFGSQSALFPAEPHLSPTSTLSQHSPLTPQPVGAAGVPSPIPTHHSPANIPTAGGAVDLSSLFSPEMLREAFQQLPPALQQDPNMQALLANPALLQQIIASQPDLMAKVAGLSSPFTPLEQGKKTPIDTINAPVGAELINSITGIPSSAPTGPVFTPASSAPTLTKEQLKLLIQPDSIRQMINTLPPTLQQSPMVQAIQNDPSKLQQLIDNMTPDELALTSKMLSSAPPPLDLSLLPQSLKEPAPLPFSNVQQGNLAFDGLGYPLTDPMAKPTLTSQSAGSHH